MEHQTKLYFRGLNGLRFFAALLVLLSHAPTFINPGAGSNIYDLRSYSFFNNGYLAVDFFFVLSGFLITSLLLKEYDETNTIQVKRFYARRILRIWPLYYLVVFIAFVIFPLVADKLELRPDPGLGSSQLLLYLLLLPNFTFIFGPRILLFPLWSIGVEEQFYALIAPVIKYKRKKLAAIFCIVIIGKILLNVQLFYLLPDKNVTIFLLDLRFEAICVGCLGAMFIRGTYKSWLNSFFNYPFQLFVFGLLFLVIFFNKTLQSSGIPFIDFLFNMLLGKVWSGFFMGLVFLYIILCISLNDKSLIRTDNKLLDYLGNISYGMYMYHVMTGFAVAAVLNSFFSKSASLFATIVYYLLFTITTMAVANLSYVFYEKRFLRIKRKFQPVQAKTRTSF